MKLMGRMLTFILLPALVGLMMLAGVGFWFANSIMRQQTHDDVMAILDSESVGMEAVLNGTPISTNV